jgi:AraC-like DNA-binding protein
MYSNELVCNILDYLDENINTIISIDMISSIFCYDKTYVMKRFKKELGISIINYMNAIKIFNSLKYFRYDDSILKISMESGFNSLEYFSEIFKKIIGVSPNTYKQFIRHDIRVEADEVSTIINSLVKLDELRNKVMFYRKRVKPSTVMVKKLSLQ